MSKAVLLPVLKLWTVVPARLSGLGRWGITVLSLSIFLLMYIMHVLVQQNDLFFFSCRQ